MVSDSCGSRWSKKNFGTQKLKVLRTCRVVSLRVLYLGASVVDWRFALHLHSQ